MAKIFSNLVKKEKLREYQKSTLVELSDALKNSFGPMGSNTSIYDPNKLNKYTKDGYTILQNIKFHNVIEQSVLNDLLDITRHIVKNVGDGTTSAVILSELMFKYLVEIESNMTIQPYSLIRDTKNAIDDIKEEIIKQKKEFTPDVAYDISMISSNGNTIISNHIKEIYERFGKDVFINVGINNDVETLLKIYDGCTLEKGYDDSAFINNNMGTCKIYSPRIYQFEDPIDTPEQLGFLSKILEHNILSPIINRTQMTPTVILAPKISRDANAIIGNLVENMFNMDPKDKPPILIVSNITDINTLNDICRLCGCKKIRKYINLEQQESDIKAGLAPTTKNVHEFFGTADYVESNLVRTKFVNPALMFEDEDKTIKSKTFNSLVAFLENELAKAKEENQSSHVIGTLKSRINSLKDNMVEILIGGVSASDRDNLKDLVEDTVLNCRSASINGVGYAANFEGLRASYKLKDKSMIHEALYNAYFELSKILYSSILSDDEAINKVKESIVEDKPLNLRTEEFDEKILCSIMTDPTILEALSNILSLMITSNQFITPNPLDNVYK